MDWEEEVQRLLLFLFLSSVLFFYSVWKTTTSQLLLRLQLLPQWWSLGVVTMARRIPRGNQRSGEKRWLHLSSPVGRYGGVVYGRDVRVIGVSYRSIADNVIYTDFKLKVCLSEAMSQTARGCNDGEDCSFLKVCTWITHRGFNVNVTVCSCVCWYSKNTQLKS